MRLQTVTIQTILASLLACATVAGQVLSSVDPATTQDDFSTGNLKDWEMRQGHWVVRDGRAVAEGGFSILLSNQPPAQDVQISADVAYFSADANAAAGVVFRFGEDSTGYLACLRAMEKGTSPQWGPWERPVLQLFRLDRDGWKLLQESKVPDCWSGRMRPLKVICRGENIWVFYDDMITPVLKQHDGAYNRAGRFGLLKDQTGTGFFGHFSAGPASIDPAPAPSQIDWSWVRGAVYVRSDAVNAVQMWENYWDHTATLDRELSYAADYGFNMVQVYLHWIVWDAHGPEYLKRIDDFVARANRYGLKVNFVLWDNCGSVEPSLKFGLPIPGRHNSQMMPNPSFQIRDNEAEMTAHQKRFGQYVQGIVGHFKDDKRISFWQIYNECLGQNEQYRAGQSDANLIRLLDWTRQWVKATGTTIPVTATGGGFYGPKYSDFYTYHSYRLDKNVPLPGADGGPDHLCTETLDRPYADIGTCIQQLAGKKNGFVVWDLMIGRDNCRFPWGHPDGPDEPTTPFHGVIYPDGHPWSTDEVRQLLGKDSFASLQDKCFQVEYFNGDFALARKTSFTPRIDFDLPDEPGAGSPDASAGISSSNYSNRWKGKFTAPVDGSCTFFADCDGIMRVWIDDGAVINKTEPSPSEIQGSVAMTKGKTYQIKAEYTHHNGPSSVHLSFAGPGIPKQILDLHTAAAGSH